MWEWAGEFFSHRLDRTRPLWEMVLVEGLADDRWALASKTHHALVDGVGSVGVVQLLLDQDEHTGSEAPDGLSPPDAPWGVTPPSETGVLTGAVGTVVRAAQATLHSALHPREAFERSLALAELIRTSEISGAPHTTLNVPIGATRRFRSVRTDLPDIKAIGHALGGSVNDVLLATCTAGVRELMLSRGERPPIAGLRAMVPMNIRSSGDSLALGNKISSLFVDLPVAQDEPERRLATITERTSALKHSNAALGTEAMLDLASLAPPVLHAMIARSMYATRLFNITITNVPGPRIPLYSLGARLHAIYPLVRSRPATRSGSRSSPTSTRSSSASAPTETRVPTSMCSSTESKLSSRGSASLQASRTECLIGRVARIRACPALRAIRLEMQSGVPDEKVVVSVVVEHAHARCVGARGDDQIGGR